MSEIDLKHREMESLAANMRPFELAFLEKVLDPTDSDPNYLKLKSVWKKRGSLAKRHYMISAARIFKREDSQRYMQLHKEIAAQKTADRLGLTEEKLVREIASMALANPLDYVDEFGCLKPLTSLTREQAAAVRNFQEVRTRGGAFIFRYQLYDKQKAIELLGKTKAVKLFEGEEDGGLDIDGLLEQLKS